MATALGEALAVTRGWGSSSSRASPRGETSASRGAGAHSTLEGHKVPKSKGAGSSVRTTGGRLAGANSGIVDRAASLESSEVCGTNTVCAAFLHGA